MSEDGEEDERAESSSPGACKQETIEMQPVLWFLALPFSPLYQTEVLEALCLSIITQLMIFRH